MCQLSPSLTQLRVFLYPGILKELVHNVMYFSFPQRSTVALLVTQPLAKLVTLLEQLLNRQLPTVVIQATPWWETVHAHVKLMEGGLEVNLSVRVGC